MTNSKVLVSPNGTLICKTGRIAEISNGTFGCKFQFVDKSNRILYLRKHAYLRELDASNCTFGSNCVSSELKAVVLQWSTSGSMVYFLEFSREKQHNFYKSVFIDSIEGQIFEIDEEKDRMHFVNGLGVPHGLFEEAPVKAELKRARVSVRKIM